MLSRDIRMIKRSDRPAGEEMRNSLPSLRGSALLGVSLREHPVGSDESWRVTAGAGPVGSGRCRRAGPDAGAADLDADGFEMSCRGVRPDQEIQPIRRLLTILRPLLP
jgi:hypothetical protein